MSGRSAEIDTRLSRRARTIAPTYCFPLLCFFDNSLLCELEFTLCDSLGRDHNRHKERGLLFHRERSLVQTGTSSFFSTFCLNLYVYFALYCKFGPPKCTKTVRCASCGFSRLVFFWITLVRLSRCSSDTCRIVTYSSCGKRPGAGAWRTWGTSRPKIPPLTLNSCQAFGRRILRQGDLSCNTIVVVIVNFVKTPSPGFFIRGKGGQLRSTIRLSSTRLD